MAGPEGNSDSINPINEVAEQLMRHRRVIPQNYAESVSGTNSENAPGVSGISQIEFVAASLRNRATWWRLNCEKFPLVSLCSSSYFKIARDALSITSATSRGCET
jgi:hypothetical protein